MGESEGKVTRAPTRNLLCVAVRVLVPHVGGVPSSNKDTLSLPLVRGGFDKSFLASSPETEAAVPSGQASSSNFQENIYQNLYERWEGRVHSSHAEQRVRNGMESFARDTPRIFNRGTTATIASRLPKPAPSPSPKADISSSFISDYRGLISLLVYYTTKAR